MISLSALELGLVQAGHTSVEALSSIAEVARRAEAFGYQRVWIAEHHGSHAIASASPAVLAAHLASATSRIRIGSGGVLAPNHSPLAVAEQFATLAALHPGRVDIGIGRGPGAIDDRIIRALRRGADPAGDDYPADVAEILGYLGADGAVRMLQGLETAPMPEPWLLISSARGAELAAELGLPIAFAHHIRPKNARESLARYRDGFRPSRWRAEPYVIVTVQTLCADSDDEAEYLARPFTVLRAQVIAGRVERALPTPDEAATYEIPAELVEEFKQFTVMQAHGGPETVARKLTALAEDTGADELMLVTAAYDTAVRVRSLELVAKAMK